MILLHLSDVKRLIDGRPKLVWGRDGPILFRQAHLGPKNTLQVQLKPLGRARPMALALL